MCIRDSLGDAAHLLDKFLFVLNGIAGGGSDGFQHQLGQGFGANIVGKTLLGFSLDGQAVGGAVIGVAAVLFADVYKRQILACG